MCTQYTHPSAELRCVLQAQVMDASRVVDSARKGYFDMGDLLRFFKRLLPTAPARSLRSGHSFVAFTAVGRRQAHSL